jgi:hypothetical protein
VHLGRVWALRRDHGPASVGRLGDFRELGWDAATVEHEGAEERDTQDLESALTEEEERELEDLLTDDE